MLDEQIGRMLRDSRSRALIDNFASRWLELSKLSGVVLDTDLFSEFDENLREAMAQETKLFVADQLSRDRSVLGASDRRLHVLERAAGEALRHSPDLWQPLSPRHAVRRPTRRAAWARQHLNGYFLSEPHIGRDAWQMGAGQPAWCASAPAAARCTGVEGAWVGGPASIAARSNGDPPQEPRLRDLPRADGSDRLRAGEFRCRWNMADRHQTVRQSTHRRHCPTARVSKVSQGCDRCS